MKTLTIVVSDDAASKLLRMAIKWGRTREEMAARVVAGCIGAEEYDEPDYGEPSFDYIDDPENPRSRDEDDENACR